MAIEDYFEGASQKYGQLAGSLLAGRRKEEKQRAERALIASTVLAGFGALQNNQKRNIADSINEINDNYTDIFQNNEEIYNRQQEKRKDYLSYLDDKEGYLNTRAIELFNADPSVQADGLRYNEINELDEESKKYAMGIFNEARTKAEEDVTNLRQNPAITKTFTKFNEAAKNEYKMALAAVEDDPYNQGVIRSAFTRIFGKGEEQRASLSNSLEKAKARRLAQEQLVSVSDTVENQEEQTINRITASNIAAAENIKSTNPEFFDFKKTTEAVKAQKDSLTKKVNTSGYELNLDDLHTAMELEVSIPGLPGLSSLLPYQRETLISAGKKAREAMRNNQNPLSVLPFNEGYVYALAMGTTLESHKTDQINLEIAEINLEEARAGDLIEPIISDFYKLQSEQNNLALQKLAMDTVTLTGKDIVDIDRMVEDEQDRLVGNIIMGAYELREANPQNYQGISGSKKSIEDSTNLQLLGIYDIEPTSFLKLSRRDTQKGTYVSPTEYSFVKNTDIETESQAQQMLNILNNKQNKFLLGMGIVDQNNKQVNFLDPRGDERMIEGPFEFFVETNEAGEKFWSFEYGE